RPGARQHAAVAEAQVMGQVMRHRIAATAGFQSQHEGAVAIEVDFLDGIHLDRDLEHHGGSFSAFCASCASCGAEKLKRRAASSTGCECAAGSFPPQDLPPRCPTA